jgi:hypothetical protein
MRVIRITTAGPGLGDPPGRRRRLAWLGLVALGVLLLIVAGVGFAVYQIFFRVPEFRALLLEGGRVARGAVLPIADGAVVLSQENAQPVAEAIRSGVRQSGAARVYLSRIGRPPVDKARWDVALDGVTASATSEVEAASWEGIAWRDEAAWLTMASPYRVDLRAGAVGAPGRGRAWPTARTSAPRSCARGEEDQS